jgi:lactate dehydrogenase-like 2-hydroxyacid dehydrogenase
MAGLFSDAADARNIVAIPYPLPDWIEPVLRDEFDLRLVQPGSAVARQAEVMLTSGPELVRKELLEQLPALKYICCLGSGYEGVDMAYASQRGIIASNSAIVTAEDVADQLLANTLSLCCQVPALDRAIREDRWHKPIRRSLRELNVGILGFGAIGQAAARRIAAFGSEIRWTGPRPKDTAYPYCRDLLELASWADILLVTARADRSNVGLVGDAVFDRLGPKGIVANVSRGSIIDENALIVALKSGRLGGAALDVFETEPTLGSRWADVPNTVLSPHVGGFATGVRRGIVQLVQFNLRAFFAGSDLTGLIEPRRG